MVTACHRNFYGRSRFSSIVFYLHTFVHLLICSPLHIFLHSSTGIHVNYSVYPHAIPFSPRCIYCFTDSGQSTHSS
ncbi:hypothetical protein M378DRAFT_623539 [Amanita muscaria Koide BX008]|uniref:Uncharacterized protein n=1 Tax=Amanita muscaria (strain Koide BX008) TaxID=946122 RepID=A0A0C2TT31_AMAMK|nr:hypothetical protein M378DRAFT_623539 [Amanita muscaria Koide BX008]